MENTDIPYLPSANGLRVNLLVTPKASVNKIGAIVQSAADGGSVLKVYVTAVPDQGKANQAVIKLMAKAWKLPKTSFSVVSGSTGRRKVIEIVGDSSVLLAKVNSALLKDSL